MINNYKLVILVAVVLTPPIPRPSVFDPPLIGTPPALIDVNGQPVAPTPPPPPPDFYLPHK